MPQNHIPSCFTPHTPPAGIISHFSSLPNAASKYFNNPRLQPYATDARVPKTRHTADRLIANTLGTPDTIAAWQAFYQPPDAPADGKGAAGEEARPYGECVLLLKIGEYVNGHIDTAHGGFLGMVLDEAIGNAAETQKPEKMSTMTAYLNVAYKRPVPTPSVIVVRTWLERVEGRKIFGRGVIEDEEGRLCVVGEALFLTVKQVTGKLKL